MNMTPEQERDALIDRYINHKLTAEEEAEFEIRMMDDSELFEQVQIRSALKAGLNQQRDRLLKPQVLQGSHKILPFRLWVQQPMSMAASFLIAALCVHILFSNPNGASDGLVRVETLVLLEQTRGDALQTFSGQPPYLFQMDVGLGNERLPFNLTLVDAASGREVSTQTGIAADMDGWIRLVIDDELRGEYVVTLEWTDGTGMTQQRQYRLAIQI